MTDKMESTASISRFGGWNWNFEEALWISTYQVATEVQPVLAKEESDPKCSIGVPNSRIREGIFVSRTSLARIFHQ